MAMQYSEGVRRTARKAARKELTKLFADQQIIADDTLVFHGFPCPADKLINLLSDEYAKRRFPA